MKKNILSLIVILCTKLLLNAQTSFYFQGFEGACNDNWGYSNITTDGTTFKTGFNSGKIGQCGGSSVATFSSIAIPAALSGIQLSISHSVKSGSGTGMDTREGVVIQVQLNGSATWTTIGQAGGNNDAGWAWTAAAGGVANTCPQTYTMPNPLLYNVPGGTTTFAVRVITIHEGSKSTTGTCPQGCGSVAATCCSNFSTQMGLTDPTPFAQLFDRSDEGFYIDDVQLTTTTTPITVTWNGNTSTDWFCRTNWTPQIVPNTGINAIFPSNNAGNRDIVINAATNPTCKDLTINGAGARQIKGEGAVTKKLTIMGNLSIGSTDGLDFSDGTTGTPDGTIELYGNWTNLGVESDFKEGESTVKFMGTANQSITTAEPAGEEAFYIFNVNKGSGTVTMNDDVWIDKSLIGGTTPLLIFTQGNLDLNNQELKIWNPNEQAVSRTLGGAISEKTTNASKITWAINNNTGAHVFPFVRTDGFYIPLTFDLTAGDVTDLTISTYPTPNNNTPFPVTPQTVTNLFDVSATDNSSNTINRFWQIDKSGASGTANLTFTYGDNEWDLSELPDYEAQRWSPSSWQAATGSQVQNTATNSVFVPGITTFSPWTLASKLLPLPIELIDFYATKNNDVNDIFWKVGAEENVMYYTIDKSNNGIDFKELTTVFASSSAQIKTYNVVDQEPFSDITYYSLGTKEKNGKDYFHKIISVNEKSDDWKCNHYQQEQNLVIEFKNLVPKHSTISLFDLSGKLLAEEEVKNSQTKINVQNFAEGIYFVRITTPYKTENFKIIIRK
jgi:hypothetical protein